MRRTIALVQFDAHPEELNYNLSQIQRLCRTAADQGAKWIMFHEATLYDYTPRIKELAQPVPDGSACMQLEVLARDLGCFLSVGLSEMCDTRCFISQVFIGPCGHCYHYRKTWLWREPDDKGYRNEWARYDPGSGPEIFKLDGAKATCFICSDGNAPRCLERAAALKPDVVFYPNNRESLPEPDVFGSYARSIAAPMLVTNRVGKSWCYECKGGCTVYSPDGRVLAAANHEGREEILYYDLEI